MWLLSLDVLDFQKSGARAVASNRQMMARVAFDFVVHSHYKFPKYQEREFHNGHCLSRNFFSGYDLGSISAALSWSTILCLRGRSAGSFPEQRLVIEPSYDPDYVQAIFGLSILFQVCDYNRVIVIESNDEEVGRVLKERAETSEREDDTEELSKTKVEVYNANTRSMIDNLADSNKTVRVCT